jgi:hypothetical protein
MDGIMLAPVTLRRTSPKLRATSATSSQPSSERCCGFIAMVRQSGILQVQLALSFVAEILPQDSVDFEDTLNAKYRETVRTFSSDWPIFTSFQR